ncbi:hypothetical protein [Methylobacterium mesophilicum]
MSVPVKPLFALGVAFAAGVGVTAAYVGAKPERATTHVGKTRGILDSVVASDATKSASPTPIGSTESPALAAPNNRSAANGWVDPVKQPVVTSPTRQPLPPLVFNFEEKQGSASDRASNGAKSNRQLDASQSTVAQVSPPKRPDISALVATPENRSATAGSMTTDRTLLLQRSDAPSLHQTKAVEPVIKLNRKLSDGQMALLKDGRENRFSSTSKRVHSAEAMKSAYGETLRHYYPYSRDRYVNSNYPTPQADSRGYREASSNTAPSGVMRWLNQ